MRGRIVLCVILLAVILSDGGPCAAVDVTLGARKFKSIAVAVYDVPSDCAKIVSEADIATYVRDTLTARLGETIRFTEDDTAPHLAVKTDCMHLVDTNSGQSRPIGYAINIIVQFYRPFYEDITYIHAATWTYTELLYIPENDFSQDFFNGLLTDALDEFANLWAEKRKP
jgi:hypothetical protein